MFAVLGLLAVAAVVGLLVVADKDGGAEEGGPRGDVRLTACVVDATTQWPHADVLVTNRSAKASDYGVHVEFLDPAGKRLSDAYGATDNLAPGQRATVRVQSLDQVAAGTHCRIVDVSRHMSWRPSD
ncbi:FxLYD domain-containing protein [Streptomyces sp. NPDC093225]|uniref:FxLYD domain-containing protein n=1 Tax=Streptomyces sp. NPDC093225 TaxID=3366034 RepID=UPI0038227360